MSLALASENLTQSSDVRDFAVTHVFLTMFLFFRETLARLHLVALGLRRIISREARELYFKLLPGTSAGSEEMNGHRGLKVLQRHQPSAVNLKVGHGFGI